VFDVSLHEADDPVIWEHARQNIAVLISKDEDFVDRWLMSDAPVADLDPKG
jgi:predicted nuclease of predicted toxin-antitoxin system